MTLTLLDRTVLRSIYEASIATDSDWIYLEPMATASGMDRDKFFDIIAILEGQGFLERQDATMIKPLPAGLIECENVLLPGGDASKTSDLIIRAIVRRGTGATSIELSKELGISNAVVAYLMHDLANGGNIIIHRTPPPPVLGYVVTEITANGRRLAGA